MKLRFPAIIFYTDRLSKGTGGLTIAFFIMIRAKYRDTDEGIHQHELCHVRRWFAITFLSLINMAPLPFFFPLPWAWAALSLSLFVYPLLYLIPRFRQREEAAAYRTQLQYSPATTNRDYYSALYAKFISEDYGLNISKEEALKLLE